MPNIKITRIPPAMSIKILKKSWELITVNYPLFLGVFFSLVIASLLLNFIPILGNIVGYFLGLIFPVFYYAMARDWEAGQPSSFSQAMSVFDNSTIKRLLPYCGMHALGTLTLLLIVLLSASLFGLSMNSELSSGSTIGIPTIFIFAVVFATLYIFYMSVMAVALPIVYYNNNTRIVDAMKLAYDGLMVNIAPLTMLGLILLMVVLACALFFIIPMIFVGTPLFLMSHYVVYRMIFENLQLE